MKVTEEGYNGPVAKFLNDDANALNERLSAKVGDLVLFVAGSSTWSATPWVTCVKASPRNWT